MYGQVITIGIIISLIFSELIGVTPAGLIVPGYLALSCSTPMKIVWTLLAAIITLGLYKLLSNLTILYGKRRFAVMILISVIVVWAMESIPGLSINIGVIGYLIPGIIAKEFERQGIIPTFLSMTAVTALVVLACYTMGVVLF